MDRVGRVQEMQTPLVISTYRNGMALGKKRGDEEKFKGEPSSAQLVSAPAVKALHTLLPLKPTVVAVFSNRPKKSSKHFEARVYCLCTLAGCAETDVWQHEQ